MGGGALFNGIAQGIKGGDFRTVGDWFHFLKVLYSTGKFDGRVCMQTTDELLKERMRGPVS